MENQPFKLSVVIPCLNEEDNLKILLPFLTQNGFNKLDIIVVDGGSRDNSVEIAHQFGARIIKTEVKHRAKQLNAGASHANEEIILFIHADVLPPKSFLKDILTHMRKGFKGGWFSYTFDQSKGLLKVNEWFTHKKGLFSGGGDQCIFVLKTTFTEIKGFDENLQIMEDFDLTRNLKKNKVKTTLIKNNCTVSSRKYKNNSWIKVNLSNLLVFCMYLLGIESSKIKAVYSKLIKN